MDYIGVVFLLLASFFSGVALIVYGACGRRESQARDGRTYKRGRL